MAVDERALWPCGPRLACHRSFSLCSPARIAECKIWDGPAKIRRAIDQLLGYLTWRDTKAALIVFIRTGKTSDVIAKAVAEIEGHPNFKYTIAAGRDSERHQFVLRSTTDLDQEIRVALLPFAVQ